MNAVNKCHIGDCRDSMRKLIADGVKVQMCVTSPPYFGLRDYQTATWEGGDQSCNHSKGTAASKTSTLKNDGRPNPGSNNYERSIVVPYRDICGKCGARRIDKQLGLEQTPQEYINNMVEVFRLVRELLSDDGTCWVNIGDSYAANLGYQVPSTLMNGQATNEAQAAGGRPQKAADYGLKPKDLIGIPWALAKAMRDPYYTGQIKQEMDRVWLAAMMDGEGSISGFYHDRSDGTGIRTGVNVCLTNTCTQIIDRAAAIWPASLHPHHMNNDRLGTKDVFRWKPSGAENVGDFLAELYPYLMTKKRQAMLAWNLMQFSKNGQKWGKSSRAEEVRQKREILVRLISSLNKSEAVIIPDWVTEPASLLEPGWYLRQEIIWSKRNCMPESVTDRCTKSHEQIFLLSKNQRYYFDQEAIKEPAITAGKPVKMADGWDTGTGSHGAFHRSGREKGKANNSIQTEKRNKRSVWEVATQPFSGAHFATFPPALIEPCILAGSRPGDIVFDPFLGSGTTGQVAQSLGRKWLGCELNPNYVDLQDERTRQDGFALEVTA